MGQKDMAGENEQTGMHRRRITLADGRYLIFYTFDEQVISGVGVEGARTRQSEPEPEAEDERSV